MKLIPKDNGLIDFALKETGALDTEAGIQSAVLISLFTDRRAKPDDKIPNALEGQHAVSIDKRGWAGDLLDNERIGSRLWLLAREKQTEETRRRAIQYAQEALDYLVSDNIVAEINIVANWRGIGRLDMRIDIIKNDGETATINVGDVLGESYAV